MIEKFFTKPKMFRKTFDNLYAEYNQWGADNLERNWFVRFLRYRFPNNRTKINFFGPLGSPFFICNKFEGKKYFIRQKMWSINLQN